MGKQLRAHVEQEEAVVVVQQDAGVVVQQDAGVVAKEKVPGETVQ